VHPVWHFVNGVPTGGVIAPSVSLAGAGSVTAPSYSFTGDADTGWYSPGAGELTATVNGVNQFDISNNQFRMVSTANLGWSSGDPVLAASDTILTRLGAGDLGLNGSLSHTAGANGQVFKDVQSLTELTTIAAAATTDTTIQMPAGAVVLAVSVRVTVIIPTAATFTVGDSGSAARFSTAAVTVAAGSTDAGTKAGAYYNASALSIRITPNLTPANNSGRVRVTIYYYTVTPATS